MKLPQGASTPEGNSLQGPLSSVKRKSGEAALALGKDLLSVLLLLRLEMCTPTVSGLKTSASVLEGVCKSILGLAYLKAAR